MVQTIRDLWPYLRPYRWSFLIAIALIVINSFVATYIPLVPGQVIDTFSDGTVTTSSVITSVLLLLLAGFSSAFLMVMVRRLVLNSSWEVQFDVRHEIFKHFTQLDGAYYDRTRVGDLMARLTADLNAVRMMVGVGIMQGMSTTLLLAVTLWRMFSLSPSLAFLTLGMAPVITLSFFFLLRIIHRRYERVQQQFANISAMAQENFTGVRVVKGFNLGEREEDDFRTLNNEFIKRNLSLVRVDGMIDPLMDFLFGLTVSFLLLLGGRLVFGIGAELTVGQFTSFVFLFEGIQWPLIAMGWILSVGQRGSTSWHRLRSILAEVPTITDGPNTNFELRELKGDIEFKNVGLSFGKLQVLKNLNLVIPEGQAIGFAGRTGSGKTVITQLLTRLVDPTEGEILVGGIPLKEFPLSVVRRASGVVPQEPFLFSDTIAENITYGVPPLEPDERMRQARAAADIAQLTGDVDGFKLGFDTRLGERGVTLSGGQRQRTSIARALARNPDILILDDALSAVDTQTEAAILAGLEEHLANRTTVITAHRVSAFAVCDKIYVIDDGTVVESGTHHELIKQDGWYADMDRRQQLEADLEVA